MDYVEAFKNLRTNNKWGRKSPHKAVLMLTVIELFEKNILTDNEIHYDEQLKSTFKEQWNRVLPQEPLFHPDVYLPFWYLQNDSFWHIVPQRGKEDILSLMRDNGVKPSEAKLYDSVKYAELDEDLYFLMTIPSGRSSLKKALLETYTNLPEWQIERMSESEDNTVDYSVAALSEYESILSKNKNDEKETKLKTDDELACQFQSLDEDLQIVLNVEYYSFLKSHRGERDIFKNICPTVYDLYDRLTKHPARQDEMSPSFAFIYENFLADLKISLMSENGAMELIDRIDMAIEVLRGNYQEEEESVVEPTFSEQEDIEEETPVTQEDEQKDTEIAMTDTVIPEELFSTESRKGKPWTENEEELIALYYRQGKDAATIANIVGRTEVSIKMRLAKLGLMEYTYGQDDDGLAPAQVDRINTSSTEYSQRAVNLDDYTIENSFLRCVLKDKRGNRVFSADGKLKRIGEKLYRLNMKSECLTIKDMKFDGSVWMRGDKKIVAYPGSSLYDKLEGNVRYETMVEDIVDTPAFFECRVKVNGRWYDSNGVETGNRTEQSTNMLSRSKSESISTFVPKGKLRCIGDIAEESYDYLLAMAVVEFMQLTPQPTIITFDRLACMMIAVAWEILSDNEELREKEKELCECIQFLMDESKEEMDDVLTWRSTRKEVFNAIKDFPMAGVFEDTVDLLTEDAPYRVLKAWLKVDEKEKIERDSNSPSSTCLYGIHPMKRNPYGLMTYFRHLYLDYLEYC